MGEDADATFPHNARNKIVRKIRGVALGEPPRRTLTKWTVIAAVKTSLTAL
jgi:hypothetical protein